MRYGTRNPGDDDILEMAAILPNIRDQILNSWEEGLWEMEEGEIVRFLDWQFNLLDQSRTQVCSSRKSRCIESGEAFLAGIFETDFPKILEDNRLLRFYENCQKFDDEVAENDETYIESNNFKSSEFFQALITRVNFKTEITLDLSQVSLMWDMCR